MTTLTETPPRITGGVDTHRDLHVVAALDERGAELGVESFPATPTGYRHSLRWLRRFGEVHKVGVEGTGSYGAGLTRYFQAEGIEVIEISCPNRQRRRSHGKSDPVDAIAAAKAVISGEATIEPKTRTGNVEESGPFALLIAPLATHGSKLSTKCEHCLLPGPRSFASSFGGRRHGEW